MDENVELEVLISVVAEGDEVAVASPLIVPPRAEVWPGAWDDEVGLAWLIGLAWLKGEGETEAGGEEPGRGEESIVGTGTEEEGSEGGFELTWVAVVGTEVSAGAVV